MKKCDHKNFEAKSNIIRLEDSGRFMMEVSVKCTECDTPFQFLGLPLGLNMEGAAMEVDGLEARLTIAPQGDVPHPLGNKFVKGFNIEKKKN